ncbi:MAG: hypothetical protein M1355_01510 [Patescibacteria group bacterium]|nr:hypothetical protein [Patescibacteria group bacterium]MCL5093788.1 hypothetical protein [Patescibacteria group bacterium]
MGKHSKATKGPDQVPQELLVEVDRVTPEGRVLAHCLHAYRNKGVRGRVKIKEMAESGIPTPGDILITSGIKTREKGGFIALKATFA